MDESPAPRTRLAAATTLIIAAVTFWIAYDSGSYGLQSRAALAIGVWWLVVLAVILGHWPIRRIRMEAAIAGLALAALAVVSAVSISWAPSSEQPFVEANRVALYLGVFLLVLVLGSRLGIGAWCDGMAVAIVAIIMLSLATRCFPDLIDTLTGLRVLPTAQNRLSYPLGYWNALGTLAALAIPLLLRSGLAARTPLLRALAIAPLPAIVGAIFLTSSRTGVLTATVGVVVLFFLVSRRIELLAMLLLTAIPSAIVLAMLARRHALVDGPLTSAAARHEGWTAAIVIVGACALAAGGQRLLILLLGRSSPPRSAAERVALVIGTAALIAAVVLAHPVRRAHQFTQPLGIQANGAGATYVQQHLLSASGNGRADLYRAAFDEFESHPIAGGGAGSFQSWWMRHRPTALYVRDAHSLYVEVLGELGVVGISLVLAVVLSGFVAARRRLNETTGSDRITVAALAAAFAAYAAAAGTDWMWEVPAVSIIGISSLALLVGSARRREVVGQPPFPALVAGVAAVALALPVIGAQAVMLISDVHLRASQSDARSGDLDGALRRAIDARKIEPWASTPYLQTALVQERAGQLKAARRSIEDAIARNRGDWSLWLVRARLEVRDGAVEAARRSLRHARSLNPLSPFLRPLQP